MPAASDGTEPTNLDRALTYARRGWRVVPIPPGEKFPRGITAWQTEGSTDEAKITHWWTQAPDHGIGIVTGATSGLWVLDVDVAGDKVGDETLAEHEAGYGDLPDTYEVITGSGGRHLYFAWPTDGQVITNSASGRLGPGLDVRGEGGFVVAPPSLHANGNRYEVEASAPDHVAPAPKWLLAMLEDPEPAAPAPRAPTTPAGDRPGDLWAAATTWAQILTPDGWTLHHTSRDGEEHWTRPGKERRDGTSATTGYKGSDVLKVFTSSHPTLAADETYTKIGYLAATKFGNDHGAAARALRADGYRTADPLHGILPGGKVKPAATLPTEPWPTPTTLPPPEPGPAFPLHTLPAWAQAHAAAVADQVQVPVDLAAMQIIGALSAACTGRANVHVSPNWSEPVNLYLAVAMRSGAGKSPSDKLVVDWIRTWQRDRMEQMADAHAKAALKVRHARKRLAKLEGSEAVDDHELFKAYEALALAEDDVPPLPRLLADDTSPEAVAGLLREHGQRLAILSTEADLFDMLLRGKPGQRANMNLFLKAWSGDSFTRDRKGGSESGPEWTELARPLLTIACSVQPSVLAQVRTDSEMNNRGLAARFMVSVPDDVIGHRDVTRRFTATRLPTTDPYETEATRLATRWCTWSNPANLHFAPAAADTLCAFLAEIEPRLARGADLEHLAEWANKLHGSIARYAGLLYLAEGGDTQVAIDADTVARAIDLGRYWMAHAAAVDTFGDEAPIARAQGLLTWIAEQGAGVIRLADMQAGYRRPGEGLDKIADYIAPVELLVGLGYLRPVDNGDWRAEVGIRRSKSPDFAVWPEIIGKPRSAVIPRSPRTASMGERDLSLSPPEHTPLLDPRGTRITRITDEPTAPVDNSGPPATAHQAPPVIELDPDEDIFATHPAPTTPTPSVPTDQD